MPFLTIPYPAIDPVLIELGPFVIRWYALAYIAGLVIGWRWCLMLAKRPPIVVSVEAVFHLGAISSTTEPDADLVVHSNFTLTMQLWAWCTEQSVPFIYASSAATYGDGEAGFDDDGSVAGLARLKPLNSYGWSKHLVDRRIARLVESNAPRPPRWAGVKFFNVYGPNEGHKGDMMSLVAKLYPRALAGEKARLFRSHNPAYPDGGQLRDFVYVRDCVDMLLWLHDHPAVNGLFAPLGPQDAILVLAASVTASQ